LLLCFVVVVVFEICCLFSDNVLDEQQAVDEHEDAGDDGD
jgi:1,4-dihydroxy-2-naphthoate octaprenyltransferase